MKTAINKKSIRIKTVLLIKCRFAGFFFCIVILIIYICLYVCFSLRVFVLLSLCLCFSLHVLLSVWVCVILQQSSSNVTCYLSGRKYNGNVSEYILLKRPPFLYSVCAGSFNKTNNHTILIIILNILWHPINCKHSNANQIAGFNSLVIAILRWFLCSFIFCVVHWAASMNCICVFDWGWGKEMRGKKHTQNK